MKFFIEDLFSKCDQTRKIWKKIYKEGKAIFTIFSVMKFFEVMKFMPSSPVRYAILWLILKYNMVFNIWWKKRCASLKAKKNYLEEILGNEPEHNLKVILVFSLFEPRDSYKNNRSFLYYYC